MERRPPSGDRRRSARCVSTAGPALHVIVCRGRRSGHCPPRYGSSECGSDPRALVRSHASPGGRSASDAPRTRRFHTPPPKPRTTTAPPAVKSADPRRPPHAAGSRAEWHGAERAGTTSHLLLPLRAWGGGPEGRRGCAERGNGARQAERVSFRSRAASGPLPAPPYSPICDGGEVNECASLAAPSPLFFLEPQPSVRRAAGSSKFSGTPCVPTPPIGRRAQGGSRAKSRRRPLTRPSTVALRRPERAPETRLCPSVVDLPPCSAASRHAPLRLRSAALTRPPRDGAPEGVGTRGVP